MSVKGERLKDGVVMSLSIEDLKLVGHEALSSYTGYWFMRPYATSA
jgi:hypothetical protein